MHVGLFSLVLITSLLPLLADAQRPHPELNPDQIRELPEVKRVYLKTNPFAILAGPIINTSEYRLGVEIVGGNRFSYELHGSYLGKWVLLNTNLVDDTLQGFVQSIQFPGVRLQGALRYYFFKNELPNRFEDYYQPSGLYISLHASYATARLQFQGQSLPRQDWTNLQVMVRLGYQVVSKDHIGMDVFTGFGFKENTAVDYDIRGRRSVLDLEEVIGPGLGTYIASPFKFALGFSFTLGVF